MRQLRMRVAIIGVTSFVATLVMYYWHWSGNDYHHLPRIKVTPILSNEIPIPMKPLHPRRFLPLNWMNKFGKDTNIKEISTEETLQAMNLIDTPGCQIPMLSLDFQKYINKNKIAYCGMRAVFLKKISSDEVQVTININKMKRYLRKNVNFYCCYRFITTLEAEKIRIRFTKCKKIESGDTFSLETDFVNVKCFESSNKNNSNAEIYDDVYAFIKQKESAKPSATCHNNMKRYNIMMIGMDTMSFARVKQTMPQTAEYLRDNFWLEYRGYHKVADNTFPNLMATLTGHNLTTISKRCAKRMNTCQDLLIWSKFREIGYVTAYGEDYLRLPDTFSRDYAFQKFPTDHFIRPLFMKGEIERNSTVCSGKVPSGRQLLEYALDFALTYRDESFFGVFWMNSFSHNTHSRSENADRIFENFFNKLSYTGVLDNTFVVFFSDHGVRFGAQRMSVESYYDERLPMLFIHVPLYFKRTHFGELKSLLSNQCSLVTPYDLYNTLTQIHKISSCKNVEIPQAKACPLCRSIFTKLSPNRTCQDVSIDQKWCSCHKLLPLQVTDREGKRSVMQIVSHIQSLVKSVRTKPCWGCMGLTLKKVIRMHFYSDKSNSSAYHVVAFTMTPGNMSYEATVLRDGAGGQLVGSISALSPYKGLGKCTVAKNDRFFCVCHDIKHCKKKRII